jgi:hypothetical protein
MDSLASNYNASANISDSSCTNCYAAADIGADTISGCDSVLLTTNTITNGSYSWNSSNVSTSVTPAIGDFYQGGIVFYLDSIGGGLISAPSDQVTAPSYGAVWGCDGITISGADGVDIGTGFQNTIDIEAGCTASGTAADICTNLTLGGYNDWFLPSIMELHEMNLFKDEIGGFTNQAVYWSSTEVEYDNYYDENGNLYAAAAYHYWFDCQGCFFDQNKNQPGRVRAVRAFSTPTNTDTTNLVMVSTSRWNYVTVTDSLGCMATDSVYVNINSPNTGSSTVTTCDAYSWNGTTYTTSGAYTQTLTNSVGCDSVHTVNLTINNSSTLSDSYLSICDANYSWNGTIYTISGAYTQFFTNSLGCDSVHTINLTFNQASVSFTNITSCDSYTWNDTTYTSSGSYSWLGTNMEACDSTATLNLAINNSSTLDTYVSICDTDYTWNGITYSVSGDYTYATTNSVGCDSTATLNLTINNSSSTTDTQIACDSYTWVDGVTYTVSNNSATHLFTTVDGCDSLSNLDLTINNHSDTSYTNITTCDSIVWNGVTYDSSGTYYSSSNPQYLQLGSNILGDTAYDILGISLSINYLGDIIAIGAPTDGQWGDRPGLVKIFQWNGSSWNQLGNSILGENNNDRNGCSVSLDSIGNTIAIGSQYNDNINNTGYGSEGQVRVFEWDGLNWNQKGSQLYASAPWSNYIGFGANIELSADGNSLAVTHQSGEYISIFSWNNSLNNWTEINGVNLYNSQYGVQHAVRSISLSKNGNRIALSYMDLSSSWTPIDFIKIYEFSYFKIKK